jgi:hypothetical protein
VFTYTFTGYMPIKWSMDDTRYDAGSLNDNAVPIFRYAEVLLNFAEAKAELGTLTDAEWAQTIGALRKRAGITGGLTAKPTKVDTYLRNTYFPGISDPVVLEVAPGRVDDDGLEWHVCSKAGHSHGPERRWCPGRGLLQGVTREQTGRCHIYQCVTYDRHRHQRAATLQG